MIWLNIKTLAIQLSRIQLLAMGWSIPHGSQTLDPELLKTHTHEFWVRYTLYPYDVF